MLTYVGDSWVAGLGLVGDMEDGGDLDKQGGDQLAIENGSEISMFTL